ncbi:hypothetical protein EDC04DRAFT_2602939 [Pisolithus marmoratus]|nr:hypothetical protein EDC04DRAFT_2602939 [Pisolithus marmoratus]
MAARFEGKTACVPQGLALCWHCVLTVCKEDLGYSFCGTYSVIFHCPERTSATVTVQSNGGQPTCKWFGNVESPMHTSPPSTSWSGPRAAHAYIDRHCEEFPDWVDSEGKRVDRMRLKGDTLFFLTRHTFCSVPARINKNTKTEFGHTCMEGPSSPTLNLEIGAKKAELQQSAVSTQAPPCRLGLLPLRCHYWPRS